VFIRGSFIFLLVAAPLLQVHPNPSVALRKGEEEKSEHGWTGWTGCIRTHADGEGVGLIVFDFFAPRLRVKTICITILPNRRFLRRFLSVFIRVHPWFIRGSLIFLWFRLF
jgi:hypothetical protein